MVYVDVTITYGEKNYTSALECEKNEMVKVVREEKKKLKKVFSLDKRCKYNVEVISE